MFLLVFLTSPPLVNTCGRRWAEESEQWTGNRRFFFRLLSSRASHPYSMPRSPSLARKAPLMQAKRGRTSATQQLKFHTDGVKSVRNPVRSADWSTE